jgi:hypothetical protein
LGGHHAGTVIGETVGLQATLGEFGLYGLISALVYLAIEPAMRRRWPWRLTAWSRVLAGRLRDPLVGRDLLVGLVSGLGLVLLVQAQLLVPEALGRPSPYADAGNLGVPGPFSPRLVLLQIPVVCLFAAPAAFALAFLLVLVLRHERLAWAGMVVLLTLFRVVGDAPPSLLDGAIVTLNSVLFMGLQVFLIARFGLWAFAASFLASRVVAATPLTSDVSAWYFWQGLLGPGVVAVLAVYGFVTATRGQRIFKGGFFGDE